MNKRESALINNIYKECLRFKGQGLLTEFGYGQLLLCEELLKQKS